MPTGDLRLVTAAGVATIAALATLAPSACAPRAELPPLRRLLPALGPAVPVTLGEVTRPATLLRPGESRTCPITANAKTRFRLSIGLTKQPERGFVVVRATAGGRTLVERRTAAGRLSSWMDMAADVPEGARELTLTAELVTANGRALPSEDEDVRIALGGPRLVEPATRPPRVVLWISQDTVRADRLSAYGYPRPTSPVLDRLAGESLLFENVMATASWTLPSLASQATSLLPSQHGAVRADLARRPEAGPTVFEVLAQQGFTVLGASANVFFSAAHGLADGFDLLFVQNVARGDILRWRLEERLAEWDGGDLALFVHFMDPHLPYAPPPPYDTMFPAASGAPAVTQGERKRNAWSGAYDGEIAFTDAQIGKLLDNLARRGLLDRALVLYTADHGDELLEHGGFDHGHSLYEELVRVPLVVRLPADRRGRRIAPPVSTLDIAPTLLAALGIAAPPSFRGENLLPLAEGAARRERYLYAETETKLRLPRQYAVREGALKAIVGFSRDAEPPRVDRQLFDLRADPGERRSLAAGALLRVAETYAGTALAGRNPSRPAALPAEAKEQLKALGYIQ